MRFKLQLLEGNKKPRLNNIGVKPYIKIWLKIQAYYKYTKKIYYKTNTTTLYYYETI